MAWLVMLMVGAAPVQRGMHVKGDLPIRLGVLPWLKAGGWLKGFMVWVPAESQRDLTTQTHVYDSCAWFSSLS